MKQNLSKEDAKLVKVDLLISKEQFIEYVNVQHTGLFNMLDPRARQYTSLSRNEWKYVIENYKHLAYVYGDFINL